MNSSRMVTVGLLLFLGAPLAAQDPVLIASVGHEVRQSLRITHSLELPAGLDVHQVSLPFALNMLRERAGIRITFSPSIMPEDRSVTCRCEAVPVREALNRILEGTGLNWGPLGTHVLIEPNGEPGAGLAGSSALLSANGLALRAPVANTRLRSRARTTIRSRTGTVRGRVFHSRTGLPVVAAQVFVQGTQLGTLTDQNGNYQISGVPAGEHTLEVQLIGFARSTASVTFQSGQVVVHDFRLSERALDLDAIVVTGTAGGMQRRAIGNVVATVSTDDVMSRVPIQNVTQLLSQRTPGVIMMPGTGQVGTGSALRIRGSGSITQGNDPIVYIDGVRMDSNPRRGPGQRGGSNVSRLNDLHPADIESVEIIKGPAAATLYGTEASSGVVQIITRRGQSGRPQVDVTSRIGTNWLWNPEGRTGMRYMPDPDRPGELFGVNVYEHERLHGTGPIFGYGLLQSHNVSVRGGTDAVRYFTSASRDHDVGVVDWNWDKRTALRGNIEALLSERFTLSLGTSYNTGRTRLAQGSIDTDPFSNLIWSNPRHLNDARRGWRGVPPEEWRKAHSRADNDRATASVEMRFQPVAWSTHRFVTGLDWNSETNWSMIPRQPEGSDHFYGNSALGTKSVSRGTRRFFTVDYAGSADFARGDFTFQPAVGFQYYKTASSFISASGQEFPDQAITSISGATVRSSGESFSENATVGLYVQQQVGWNNRVFVTGAVRGDDNSAFGAEFDAAIYPKLSATWVISEEPFWDVGFVDQLRFRGAWGAAGEQPGTFAAARLYSPGIGYRDQPALNTSSFGNPQLKPERGEELELGFDATLLDGRLHLEFTRYDKAVKDAIINRQLPPSTGFSGSQVVNLGLLKVWGNELGVVAHLVDGNRFAWELDTQLATMSNRIESLGGLDAIFAGTQSQHREGYSIADLFMLRVLSAEWDADGNLVATCDSGTGPDGVDPGGAPMPCRDDSGNVIAPQVWLGHTQPRWQVGIGNTFTFSNNFRIYARVEGNGGHKQVNTEIRALHNQSTSQGVLLNDPMLQATRTMENDRTGVYEAGFLRLRELSASYDLPGHMAQRLGASRASVTMGMRNVMMLWTAQHGWSTPRDGHVVEPLGNGITWDPEVRSTGQNAVGYQTVMPPTASATMSIRLSF